MPSRESLGKGHTTKEVKFTELDSPPLLLRNDGEVAGADDWTWVCVGRDRKRRVGWEYERIDGAGVWVYTLHTKIGTASYVSSKLIGGMQKHIPAKVMAIAKGLVSPSLHRADFFELIEAEDEHLDTDRSLAKLGRRCIEEGGLHRLKPQAKVASGHHLHITPDEAFDACVMAGKYLWALETTALVSKMKDASRATLATMLTYVAVGDPVIVGWWLGAMRARRPGSIKAYSVMAKRVTVRAKQLQHASVIDLSQLFETEVLLNRGVGEMDWNSERTNRTQPVLVPAEAQKVREIARRIFTEGAVEGYNHFPGTFEDWWAKRWMHVPGGSAHAKLEKLKKTKNEFGNKDYFSKKVMLSMVQSLKFGDIVSLKPGIEGHPSVKYEWGKQRAIYGTGVEGFILADLVYGEIEQSLPSYIPIGKNAADEKVNKTMETMMPGMLPFCFDYEDFNSQHSAEAMEAVLLAYRDVFAADMSNDQLEAAMWTEKSIYNQTVQAQPGVNSSTYATKGTLLSGWRLTTIVNSILNRAYLEMSGSVEHAGHAIHSGDDVFAVTLDLDSAEKFRRSALKSGIRAQTAKAATGSIAEFLRIDHRGTVGSQQYLARGTATLVHSRLESDKALNPEVMVKSYADRTREMKERGADASIVDFLMDKCLLKAYAVFDIDEEVNKAILEYHPLQGGLNAEAFLGKKRVVFEGYAKTEDEEREHVEAEIIAKQLQPGLVDFSKWMVYDRKVPVAVETIVSRALRATIRGLVKVRRTAHVEHVTPTERNMVEHNRYGEWKSLVLRGVGSILKGLDPALAALASASYSSALATLMKNSDDVVRLARVMF